MKTFTVYIVYFIWIYLAFNLIRFNNAYISLAYFFFMLWFSAIKVFPFLEKNFSDSEIPTASVEENI